MTHSAAINQSFLDSIPDIMFQVNRLGMILGFKPSKQYPLAVSYTEVMGQYLNEILPPQVAKIATDGITIALDTGEIQLFEYTLAQYNKTMYFEARITKASEENALIIIRDISDRRQSEACDLSLLNIAVKVQEERPLDEIINYAYERIRAIFGVRLLWVGRKESDGSVKLFSPRREFGEFVKETILHWNDSPEDTGLTGTAIRTGKFQLMSVEDPRMLLWREQLTKCSVISGAAFPLKARGSILGALTIYTDDHDFWTKRTIVQLTHFSQQIALAIYVTTNRQQLKLLTTGMDSVVNAIVITNQHGDIQWVNPAFLKLNGYSTAEAITSNVRILESCQHSRFFYKAIRQHISAGRIWCGEMFNRRKDGSQYASETTITPVRNEGGEVIHFISIIQDITERKQVETEMLEARASIARTERLSALGTMAAGIAHEINQPLNSLKVLADGMLYWYEQGAVPEISDTMDTIQEISKQAERIDAIIKHMRSIIYGGRIEEPVLCHINRGVEESLLLIDSQLLSHGIKVKTDLAVHLPPISGNSTQLEQVIINLLVNAMQALDKADKPDKQITIITGVEKGKVFLSISDNGVGISKEVKNKIFDPFFTTKFAGEGMGLGLSIVHSIVTSFGAQIKVKDNKPAAGVTFRIGFPDAISKGKGELFL
ncbi:MAG: PAS domain S-box protein [Sporomusaceae bacterium]|nr:PAS domain S-box protein [Sporomusaceae bacterium]